MLRALMVAALAGYVSAYLSCECQYALATIAANPEAAACLSPDIIVPGLTPSLAGVKKAENTTISGTIDAWLTNMCAATPCSQQTFSAVVSNLTDGCSADNDIPKTLLNILQDVEPVYSTVRKMVCLKDSDQYCATQTLQTVLGSTASIVDLSNCQVAHWLSNVGTIVKTLKAYTQIRPRGVRFGTRTARQKGHLAVQVDAANPVHHHAQFGPYGLHMNSNATCTTCVKGAATIINEDFPDAMDCLFPGVRDVCMADSNSSDGTQTDPTPPTSTQSNPSSSIPTQPNPAQSTTKGTNPKPKSSAVQLGALRSSGALCTLSLVAVVIISLV